MINQRSERFKTANFEVLSLFGHVFETPEECITCDICCPGSCTGCTQCHACHMTFAHGEKGSRYWEES